MQIGVGGPGASLPFECAQAELDAADALAERDATALRDVLLAACEGRDEENAALVRDEIARCRTAAQRISR